MGGETQIIKGSHTVEQTWSKFRENEKSMKGPETYLHNVKVTVEVKKAGVSFTINQSSGSQSSLEAGHHNCIIMMLWWLKMWLMWKMKIGLDTAAYKLLNKEEKRRIEGDFKKWRNNKKNNKKRIKEWRKKEKKITQGDKLMAAIRPQSENNWESPHIAHTLVTPEESCYRLWIATSPSDPNKLAWTVRRQPRAKKVTSECQHGNMGKNNPTVSLPPSFFNRPDPHPVSPFQELEPVQGGSKTLY